MTDIGALLREKRMEQGYSIEDIQEITKIRKRYILAIEEGRLEELPGKFYAKAFIKTYAEVVELDLELLDNLQDRLPSSEIEPIPTRTNTHSMAKAPSKLGKWFMLSFVYIFIAVILLLIYMFWVNQASEDNSNLPGNKMEEIRIDTTEEPSTNEEANQESSEGTKPDNNSEEVKPTIEVTKVSTTQYKNRPLDSYEVVVSKETELKIQIKFNDICWYDLRENGATGKQLDTNTLKQGQETEAYVLNDQVWIHFGNAAAADIYINDKKFAAGVEKGQPKYISIKKVAK